MDVGVGRGVGDGQQRQFIDGVGWNRWKGRSDIDLVDNHYELIGAGQAWVDLVIRIAVGDDGRDGVGARALGLRWGPGDDAAGADVHAGGRTNQGVASNGRMDVGVGRGVGDGQQRQFIDGVGWNRWKGGSDIDLVDNHYELIGAGQAWVDLVIRIAVGDNGRDGVGG